MSKIKTPEWNDKNRVGNLMWRLYQHAIGEITMTSTQIQAAKVYLAKIIPDMKSVEVSGEIKTNYVMQLPLPQGMSAEQWQKAYQTIQ
jgi:hypothetical protein